MKNKINLEHSLYERCATRREKKITIYGIDEKIQNKIKERKRMQTQEEDSIFLREQQNKNVLKENKKYHPLSSFMSIIMILASLSYITYAIFWGNNQINQTEIIIQSVLLLLLSISLLIGCKKNSQTISIFLIIILSCFCLLTKLEILKLPTNSVMKDFTNKSIEKAITWADANHITVEQIYDDSETVEEYHIIKQSVYPNVIASSIKNVEFTVSSGPDYNKETVIPDMTGWNLDEAVEIIEENFLNNVTVEFEQNEDISKDTIISQSRKGNMKRNDEMILKVSFGNEETNENIIMEDLKNLTEFKATLWLKRNNIPYEIKREFSNKIKKKTVINQTPKKGDKVNHNSKVELIISKGKKIKVPDLKKMNQKEITKWIIKNRLKIEWNDRYDEKIKKGKIIEVSHKKDEVIEEGTTIKITTSKGILTFKKFESLEEFRNWANRYGISFTEEYEQSKDIKQGNIIRFSVKEGNNINPQENIVVTISSGDTIMIPNFIGKRKAEIESTCKNININCTFYYAGSSDKDRDIAVSQNKKAGSEVVKDTYVNIGLSSGKKTNHPNINTSTNKPSTSGSQNNNTPAPTPKPVCNTKTFYIQPTWIAINDPNTTCNNIKNNNSGYKFNCNFIASDSGRKGQVLNANQLNGTTINSCNAVTLNIKNN